MQELIRRPCRSSLLIHKLSAFILDKTWGPEATGSVWKTTSFELESFSFLMLWIWFGILWFSLTHPSSPRTTGACRSLIYGLYWGHDRRCKGLGRTLWRQNCKYWKGQGGRAENGQAEVEANFHAACWGAIRACSYHGIDFPFECVTLNFWRCRDGRYISLVTL